MFWKKSSTVTFKLTADAQLNSCGKPSGVSAYYRVAQVTSVTPLEGLLPIQVWDKEKQVFGDAILAGPDGKLYQEDFISPGGAKELKITRNENAKYIVLYVNFCQTKGSCWYYAAAPKKELKLSLGSTCVAPSAH
jgi:hypothetical protein